VCGRIKRTLDGTERTMAVRSFLNNSCALIAIWNRLLDPDETAGKQVWGNWIRFIRAIVGYRRTDRIRNLTIDNTWIWGVLVGFVSNYTASPPMVSTVRIYEYSVTQLSSMGRLCYSVSWDWETWNQESQASCKLNFYRTARRYIPNVSTPHNHSCKKLRSKN
jgi:hypothetical protein